MFNSVIANFSEGNDSSVNSSKGNLISPVVNPMISIAFFTGIGFVSMNNGFTNLLSLCCKSLALFSFPSKCYEYHCDI